MHGVGAVLPSGAASSAEEVGGPRKAVGRHSARACPVRRGGICLAAVAIRTPRPCTTRLGGMRASERALSYSLVGLRESPLSSARLPCRVALAALGAKGLPLPRGPNGARGDGGHPGRASTRAELRSVRFR
ncbi:hypothetical protein MTO96_008381 [Rhipicephalus appendiculatus]